jgi:hypothetical protein
MNYNAYNMPGYGDEATWGPCTGHYMDPRTPDYDHLEQEAYEEEVSFLDNKTLSELRRRGFAVVVFTPSELNNVDPTLVEDVMTERAWDVIEAS